MEERCEIDRLPKACVSHVISFTSPRDSCRAAGVSSTFCQAADSNTVWRRFLPSDYHQILTRAIDSVSFSSCKELYFKLCNSVLIDGGEKVFALEKETGAKCITVCAKELVIEHGNNHRHWRWVSHPDSRFTEVAELCEGYWLDVQGIINCKELSPNTAYKSYLTFKTTTEAAGLRLPSQVVSAKLETEISIGKACIHPNDGGMKHFLPPEVLTLKMGETNFKPTPSVYAD